MPYIAPLPVSISPSLLVARQRVISFYRQCLRASPDIVEFHYLDVTIPQVRRRVRQEFEKNRYVADIRVVDTLLTKGRMELDETLNKWKNKTHVMRYFTDDPKVVPKQGFLDAFYEGKV